MSEPVRGDRCGAFLRTIWMPSARSALTNLLGLAIWTAVSQGCNFGALLILTHGLSQSAFGAVILALNVQVYLVALGTFGLNHIAIRDLVLEPERADETTTTFLGAVGFASLSAGILTAAVVAVVPLAWDERVMLWCVAGGNVFSCLNLNSLFDSAHRQALAAALMVPGDLLTVVLLAVSDALGELSVRTVGFVVVGRVILTAGLHLRLYGRVVRPLRWAPARAPILRMMRRGWPVLVASLFHLVPSACAVILLRIRAGTEAAAIFGLAHQLATALPLIFGLLSRVLLPHINGPHGLARAFVRRLTAVVAFALLGLVSAGTIAGWILFEWVIDPNYRAAFPVYVVLLAGYAICGIGIIVTGYLIRFQYAGSIQVVNMISAGVFLVASGLFPPTPFMFAACVSLSYLVGCGTALARVCDVGGSRKCSP